MTDRRLAGFLSVLASLFAGACGQEASYMPAPPPPPVAMERAESVTVTGARMQAPADGLPAEAPAEAYLAYSHSLSLRLPAGELTALYQAHVSACQAAGLARCQIVHAQLNEPGSDRPSAWLALRAEPGWIGTFRNGLESELGAAGGEIVSEQTSVEDLTTQIVDGEARLRARLALRDRLQDMLETREGDLEDILAVERELADVQSDIEARESVLAALRQRVTFSQLNLNYQAAVSPAASSNFEPIARAFEDMTRVFAEAVGALILFLAAALPWLVVGVPAVWLLARWLGRILARRKAAKA
ncbi:DUF4349 domain-containing protein [Marinicauda algicola]|uniref:DUF4349 domain-containing protein n=1 Tax=Marinicauda algicola TaxID=2029849 RepID=A0A4S2GYP9_9PROT|nr:DUF4349 domain-containing protein [Marinicauda algicola]TGY88360.1 DUF4349 domain-containing protein [Marinicauda algicola]